MPILNWLTRDEDIRTAQHVPYRLLEEVPDLSAGDGGAGNMLIKGDNLEALKALLPFRDIEGRVYFPKSGRGRPRIKKYQFEESGLAPMTWWTAADFGDNQQAKKETLELFNDEDAFDTPKPEKLIERILHIATNPGDLVLDSFLGSGTTMAVAIKTGRRSIGIEMGEHAATYCVPRLRKVIEGEQGGVSKTVGWQGGSGFRFYRLGPPVFDEEGHIRQDICFPVLAAHVWFSETDRPWDGSGDSPLLGIEDGHAYALLYNGILGDNLPFVHAEDHRR